MSEHNRAQGDQWDQLMEELSEQAAAEEAKRKEAATYKERLIEAVFLNQQLLERGEITEAQHRDWWKEIKKRAEQVFRRAANGEALGCMGYGQYLLERREITEAQYVAGLLR